VSRVKFAGSDRRITVIVSLPGLVTSKLGIRYLGTVIRT
jgi:hypothetical protein